MRKTTITFLAAAALGACAAAFHAHAQTAAVPVGVDTFVRAETDTYMAGLAKVAGVGKLRHLRELTSIDNQRVIRMNRDTLYSSAVFDLDAGPVTIALPDAGKRYVSMHVISQGIA